MDPELAHRLVEAGIHPSRITDPAEAWLRLHHRFGARATLIDRYALEADSRRVAPEELSEEIRRRIAQEVLEIRSPGIELLGSTGGDAVDVVSYDLGWQGLFGVWRRRLATAIGSAAVRVEHIGSTAVPGLVAKPVVDVLVGVPDVEHEQTYVSAIETLGLVLRVREPGHRYFRPPLGRARSVHVHVCEAGSRWERDHVLFCDYLRAHTAARDAYADLKLRLADRHRDDRLAYNDAKTGFILDALTAAYVWAESVSWSVPERERDALNGSRPRWGPRSGASRLR